MKRDTRPGKLRAGRVLFGKHYRRARWHPFRRAKFPGIVVAFSLNPSQEEFK